MKIIIEITQVKNGIEYEGILKLDKKKFNFNLIFDVHIEELGKHPVPSKPEEVMGFSRKMFRFNLKNEGNEIEIDDKLFGFLVGIIVELTLDFYNNPQTKMNNESDIMSGLLEGSGCLLSQFGVEASIGMSCSIEISDEFIPEVLK